MGLLIIGAHKQPPKYRCLCCPEQVTFAAGEERAYEDHVVRCSRRHDEELRSHSMRVKAPLVFDPDVGGEVDLEKWVRKYRALILEGRKTM